MARTALTVQNVALTGLAVSYVAANADGHAVANDGNVALHVKNTGGGACTVTVTATGKMAGVSLVNPAVSVPATTGDRMIGPFDTTEFNQMDGSVYVDYSTTSGVTVAAIRLPKP